MGSAVDRTAFAERLLPFARTTPTALPSRTRIWVTVASRRISTPRARRRGECLGKGSHAAEHESPRSDAAVDGSQEVVGEGEGGARGGRIREMADHALVREGRDDFLGLEIFPEEIFRAVEEKASEQLLGFRVAQESREIRDRHGWPQEHRLDQVVDLGPHRLVAGIGQRVALRETSDRRRRPSRIVPKAQRPAIRKRAEGLGIEGDLFQSVPRELQVLDDLGTEQS